MTASENPRLTPHQDPGFYQGRSLGEPVALIEFCQHPEVSNGVIALEVADQSNGLAFIPGPT